jgi:hypothetical protein
MNAPAQTELRRQGAEALRRGEYPEAVACLRAAVQADPQDVEALVLLGVASSQNGDHAGALQVLDRAAELAPGVANVHYNRALALERSGAADAAEWGFREALRLDPQHQPARRKLEVLARPVQEAAPDPPPSSGSPRPGQAPVDSVPDVQRNLVRCPACGAHTRRGRHCERCEVELPGGLRLPPLDSAGIKLPPPEIGRPVGPLRLVFIGAQGAHVSTGGWLGPAVGAAGLVLLATGSLSLFLTLSRGEDLVSRLVPAVLQLVLGVFALRLFHQLTALFRFNTSRRIECSRFLGLFRSAWRAEQFDAVHFAVDLPDKEGRETCSIRLETPAGAAPLRLGPVHVGDREAAELLRLAVLLARTVRLPLQVDGYPRNAAPELREALGRIG